ALMAALHAFAFDLTDTKGVKHGLAESKGRWVVLNFWATWCVPCIQEIPEIAEFHRRHADIVVVGVAIDVTDPELVKRFARKIGHDYPLVLSDDSVEKQLGSPKALPTTRIYDPSGKLIYDKPGRVDLKFLEEKTGSASRAQRAFHALMTRFG
ncbi:MAG TPA: TlpA disulfide reductase family protein, partial [Usitatibacter sp.]